MAGGHCIEENISSGTLAHVLKERQQNVTGAFVLKKINLKYS